MINKRLYRLFKGSGFSFFFNGCDEEMVLGELSEMRSRVVAVCAYSGLKFCK